MNTRNMLFPSNRFCDVERVYMARLRGMYGEGEVRQFLRLLAEEFLGWNGTDYLLHRREPVNQSDLLRLHAALLDLERWRPIQHIVGHVWFCGLSIEVGPQVLIPRPETEEMVGHVLQLLSGREVLRVVDLCTGSGCIAIALKRSFPQAEVVGVDVSAAALDVARRNAVRHRVQVEWLQADVLEVGLLEGLLPQAATLIVANPPYVLEAERGQMCRNVTDYEPATALFVPDADPLRFHGATADYAAGHLAGGGWLVMEINESQGAATTALLEGKGYGVQLHRDFQGKDRFVVASLS